MATNDQEQPPAQLLTLRWRDLSALPLEPGAPTTAEAALADLLLEQWVSAYQGQVADLLAQHPDAADPYDLEVFAALSTEVQQTAAARLDRYEESLRRYLDTQPSEDELVRWLADRALADAGTWARGDALDMRRRAQDDFYAANPTARAGRWTISPDSAAEARCRDVAGRIYPTYQDAEAALGGAWHRNCIHYVERAE